MREERRIELYEGDIEADMERIGTIKAADLITGGLSKPSKMPEWAYNLPATECQVGGRLQQIRGSVCQRCYALTNRYRHQTVIEAMHRRFEGIFHPDWVPAMALTIRKREVEHMRVHDSGDFQAVEHVLNWMRIADATPETEYWAPSREIEMVRRALRECMRRIGVFPENFVIRMSATMIGDPGPRGFENTSSVHANRRDAPEGSFVCPAPDQGNRCGECRACWNRLVKNVSYWLH